MSLDPSRVTVVVPMHNSEDYLEQALASIVAQTFGGWEAVLVDDASSDRTYELASSFVGRDPGRFRLVRLTENVGVARARNIAIENSSGTELVALLDHDDYWLDRYLERALAVYDAAATNGRRVGVVASNALLHTASGITGETFADRRGWVEEIDYDAMIERNRICARALFTRAAYEEVGGFSASCPGSDDYDFWLRVIEAGYEVETIREPIAVYRLHPGAMSRDDLLVAEGAIAAYTRALARGALTPRRRRAVRARIRHNRALRERALVRRALRDREYAAALRRALRAAPYGIMAFLQAPGRWTEWLGKR